MAVPEPALPDGPGAGFDGINAAAGGGRVRLGGRGWMHYPARSGWQAGGPARNSPASGSAPAPLTLTATEQRVAALAAAGHTNRQVAAAPVPEPADGGG